MIVLITGGNGTMAQAIKIKLKKLNYKVLTPDKTILDVTNESNIKSYMQKNKPNIVINCAGFILPSSIKETNLSIWNQHLKINITGAFLCCKYSILNGCKLIINIGSTSAFEGRKNWGAYCSSKAALMSLTETLANEEIESYCLHPARTDTKMRKTLFPTENKASLMNPKKIADFIVKILRNEFANGSHIIVKKDKYYVLPIRKCP